MRLGGSYRISTALALGWSLRSATGFELDIPTRDGGWATDDHGAAELAGAWRIETADALVGGRLIVAIGVLRNPADDIGDDTGAAPPAMLRAQLDAPVTSGQMAQASVSAVRAAVAAAAARLRPQTIDLYFAGPAALAVALGHRWNALPQTQLHEFLAPERRYLRTAVLG